EGVERTNKRIECMQEERTPRGLRSFVATGKDRLRLFEDLVGKFVPEVVIKLFARKIEAEFFNISRNIRKSCLCFGAQFVVGLIELGHDVGGSGLLENESRDVPELVGEVFVGLDFVISKAHIGAGRVANDECHARGVGAILGGVFDWVTAVPERLRKLL